MGDSRADVDASQMEAGAVDLRAAEWEGRPVEDWRVEWRIPKLSVFERVSSTNDVARRLAEAGAPARTVVLAEAQTAGRGRGGTRWHDRPGSALLCSVVLRPRLPTAGPMAPGTLPLRVGLAAAAAIERAAGISVRVKWPNDLLVDVGTAGGPGRKVAGILCEASLSASAESFVVVGVGVNVGQTAEDFPPELRGRAASLGQAAGRVVSRAALAGAILDELDRIGEQALLPFDELTRGRLDALDALRGQDIRVDGGPVGQALGIAPDGALRVRYEKGVETIRSGTVRFAQTDPILGTMRT